MQLPLGNQVERIDLNHSSNQQLSVDIKFVFQLRAAKRSFLKGRMVVFYFEEGQNIEFRMSLKPTL